MTEIPLREFYRFKLYKTIARMKFLTSANDLRGRFKGRYSNIGSFSGLMHSLAKKIINMGRKKALKYKLYKCSKAYNCVLRQLYHFFRYIRYR